VLCAALIFPSCWVAFEFFNALTSPHGTARNLAHTLMDFVPVLQVASVTGIWSISFCLFLSAATAAVLVGRQGNAVDRLKLASIVSVTLLLMLGFGFWRLYVTPPAQPTVTVRLLAFDLHLNPLAETPADTVRLFNDYATQARALAAQGARVIVIPEKIA
jgi:apolipoprotein N-acyltransferase